MPEEWTTIDDKSNLKKIAIVVIAIIVIGSLTALTLSADEMVLIQAQKPSYSTFYSSVTPEEAKELLDNNVNIVIVDVRKCDCKYEAGHIPTAIWQIYAPNFYDSVHDLLVYCQNGTESKAYCEELVGYTYGDIYHLQGGIDAWIDRGYETVEG